MPKTKQPEVPAWKRTNPGWLPGASPTPTPTPYSDDELARWGLQYLSNLEAVRQALGTSEVRRGSVQEWQAQSKGLPWVVAALEAEERARAQAGLQAANKPTASPGLTAMGAGATPATVGATPGLPDTWEDMMYMDPTGYQILMTLGPEGYQTYLWNKAGIDPDKLGAGGSTGPFGFSQSDWNMLTPLQRSSYINKVTGVEGADLATTFGLSPQEWAMLTPAQQESLKNYVSRYDPTGGAGGDPYGAEKMRLAWAQLAQERAMQEAQLAARRREMAAQIGQNVAQMRMQGWQTGLPWSLPEGMKFAPAFEPGGSLAALYAMSGSTYNPAQYFLAKNNPPSSDQLMNWVNEAMGRFG